MPNSNPLSWSADSLRLAISAAGVALWSWNVTNDRFSMDGNGFALWNMPQSETVTFEDLSAHIHPSDRERVRSAFVATRAIVGAYEIDFRIVVAGEIRWISARGIGDDTAVHMGLAYGIFLDVTGRKQAEEGHELLAGEMSHRVKNLLAIAMGLTQLTSRSTTTAKEMAVELIARLAALRAGPRPGSPAPWPSGDCGLARRPGGGPAVTL